jgi:hypothetical protein
MITTLTGLPQASVPSVGSVSDATGAAHSSSALYSAAAQQHTHACRGSSTVLCLGSNSSSAWCATARGNAVCACAAGLCYALSAEANGLW